MTVSQEMYGNARLERKNIPPPLSLSGFNYPSMTLQQQHINLANTVPKSAPPQSSNNDFMQTLQLQFMLQSESKSPPQQLQSQYSSPAPSQLHSQFSTPGSLQSQFSNPSPLSAHNLQSQFSSPPSLPSHSLGNLHQLYNPAPLSPMVPMSLDSPSGGGGGNMSNMGHQSQQQSQDGNQQQQQQQDGKNNASRYKTELCRPYEESGGCKYGEKCQFAHGIHELRNLSRHPKYKTELCRTFHTIGFCPYGPRCHFIHNTEEKRAPPISPGPHNAGSNATLQNLPALLSLFQQSSNVNKVMTFLSKLQLQLGVKNPEEVMQYLNLNSANLISTPPTTPNMFNFPEHMVPAAQALNQVQPASRQNGSNTSNIHSYFNFNLALKDQHLSSLLSAANMHNNMLLHPNNPGSPAGTPPLQGAAPSCAPALSTGTLSNESSPMSDKNSDLYHGCTPSQVKFEAAAAAALTAGGFHPFDMRGFSSSEGGAKLAPVHFHQHDKRGNPEYMTPGSARVTQHADEMMSANGKRLPIFNQLSDPVC